MIKSQVLLFKNHALAFVDGRRQKVQLICALDEPKALNRRLLSVSIVHDSKSKTRAAASCQHSLDTKRGKYNSIIHHSERGKRIKWKLSEEKGKVSAFGLESRTFPKNSNGGLMLFSSSIK